MTSLLKVALIACCICGCARLPNDDRPVLDKSLLTDDPCRAPCWAGLIPGEATRADVLHVLAGNAWVKPNSVIHKPISILWEDRGNRFYQWNVAHMRDDRLVLLEIQIDHVLTLEQIVARFGPPEAIYAYEMLSSYEYGVHFYYPAIGMSFQSVVVPANYKDVMIDAATGVLMPDMAVSWANYYSPAPLEDVLRDAFGMSEERAGAILSDLQPWNGFGQVRLCCQ